MKTMAIIVLSIWFTLIGTPAETASYEYDLNGRLVSVVYAPGRKVTYGYDAVGNTTSVTVAIQTGDVNGDGNTDLVDAVMILQITVGVIPVTQSVYSDIDVHGNQRISMDDTLFILQKVAEIR